MKYIGGHGRAARDSTGTGTWFHLGTGTAPKGK